MGGCSSKISDIEKAEVHHNQQIEEKNLQDAVEDAKIVKILLLGAGESGKSTILKQLKVMYGAPLSEDERKRIMTHIFSNMKQTIKILCEKVPELNLSAHFRNENARIQFLELYDQQLYLEESLARCMKGLWNDEAIQLAWQQRSKFFVLESSQYFLDRLDLLVRPGYVPTDRDVLMARVRTAGIIKETFIFDGRPYWIFDVGGQRNERRKWIHCFQEVSAVIFVAALSEYDQNLFEDSAMNRMMEAIQLFDEVCNNSYFTDSTMILFLNKSDLFNEKIQKVPITGVEHFRDYSGEPHDSKASCDYFRERFLKRNRHPLGKQVYVHVTCATDIDNIRTVFDAVRQTIVQTCVSSSQTGGGGGGLA